eukprot:3941007-Rhodomonas_salina.2
MLTPTCGGTPRYPEVPGRRLVRTWLRVDKAWRAPSRARRWGGMLWSCERGKKTKEENQSKSKKIKELDRERGKKMKKSKRVKDEGGKKEEKTCCSRMTLGA